MSSPQTPVRPLRADAVRNRKALMDAAREVFAARGLDATLDDVAHAAGVGVGTAYRHFANKQELAVAIFSDDFAQMVELAQQSLEIEDPWQAVTGFIEAIVAKHAHDRGLYELFAGLADGDATVQINDEIVSLRLALTGPVSALVDRAKASGCLREDVAPSDIAAIFMLMGESYAMSDATDHPVWRRYLQLFLDGLRAVDRPALPCEALDLDELDTALKAIKARKH